MVLEFKNFAQRGELSFFSASAFLLLSPGEEDETQIEPSTPELPC